jgi:hypothetical protein
MNRRNVAFRIFFVVLACAGTMACSPNRLLRIYSPDATSSTPAPSLAFKGLDRARPGDHVKVLLVHGIGQMVPEGADQNDIKVQIEESSYSVDLVQAMQKELNLKPASCAGGAPSPPITHIDADEKDSGNYGFMRQEEFRSDTGTCYTFYTLFWATLTEPFKQVFLSYDWKDSEYRAHYNNLLKGGLLDHDIADAVVFSGKFKDHLNYTVEQALCLVENSQACNAKTTPGPRDKIFVISHSLGSRLVIDAIDAIDQLGTPETPKFKDSLAGVFMLANQLPLLALSDQANSLPVTPPSPPAGASPNRAAAETSTPAVAAKTTPSGLMSLRHLITRRKTPEPLQLVAFSDPNDLLSYTIPADWKTLLGVETTGDDRSVSFINVLVRNHAINIGVFVNPLDAHVGYWNNPFVWKLIAHGSAGTSKSPLK